MNRRLYAGLLVLWILMCWISVSRAIERYAILVGINHVPDIGSSYDLRYAERDVDLVHGALLNVGYYQEDHIHVLKGAEATLSGIRAIIYQVGKDMAQDSTDVLLIYLAMHGTLLPSNQELDGNDEAFLPFDAKRGNPGTYLKDDDLVSSLRDVGGQVILFLDVCFAGGRGDRTWRDPGHKIVEFPDFSKTDDLATAAAAVLAASRGDEPAKDGVFAPHLVSALKHFEQDDRMKNQPLSVKELADYVSEEVSKEIQGQHPQLLPGYRDVSVVDWSKGYVFIDSYPSDAAVALDNQPLGQTTPLKDWEVPVGTRKITLTKDGYDPETDYLDVHPGVNPPKSYTLKLVMGTISGQVLDEEGRGLSDVEVVLIGGSASLPGERRTTPTDAEGNYTLLAVPGFYSEVVAKAAKVGYENQSIIQTVRIIGKISKGLPDVWLKRIPASIIVDVNLSPAIVYLDGKQRGTTPLTIPGVPVGRHTVVVTRDDAEPYEEVFYYSGTEVKTIQARLKQIFGRITVTCLEKDAIAYLDGSSEPLRVADLTDYSLPIGSHRIVVTKPGGYEEWSQEFEVQRDHSVALRAQISRAGRLSISGSPSDAEVQIFVDGEWKRYSLGEVLLRSDVYEVRVSRGGYEPKKGRVTIETNKTIRWPFDLTPKSRGKAALRSLVIPGGGQFYSDRKVMGTFLLLAELGTIGGAVYEQLHYQKAKDDYWQAVSDYNAVTRSRDLPPAEERVKTAHDRWNKAFQARRIVLAAIGGVWAYNILDALIFMPGQEESNGASLEPSTLDGAPILLATVRW